MPFSVDVHHAHNLAVAVCDGRVREHEIHDAIEFSFGSTGVPGTIDRAVRIEATADLRELDGEALHRIQSHVVRAHASPGAIGGFRSVLIAPSPFHRPIAELYKAIWDSDRLPGVEFSVVATPAEAAAILGLPLSAALLMGRPATVAPRPQPTG